MENNVQINIFFLNAISQIPSYTKFLKDLATVKRKSSLPRETAFATQASCLIQQPIAPKYEDLGSLTISVRRGDQVMDQCLLDLGVSIKYKPFIIFCVQTLGLGEWQPTNHTLLLADRLIKIPKGIVEDVILKVEEFYFPADFVVLDTEPVRDPSSHSPVILGRPFLTTANIVIRCRNGVMTLSFGNMIVELNVFQTSSQPHVMDDHEEVNMIDIPIGHTFEESCHENPFEKYLAHFGMNFDIEESMKRSTHC